MQYHNDNKTLLGQWLNSSRKAKSDTLAYLNAVANAPCLQSASDHCSSNGILALALDVEQNGLLQAARELGVAIVCW